MIKTYFDTSVFGGVFDDEFSEPSKKLFERVKYGLFQVVTSEIIDEEIKNAPARVQDFYYEFLPLFKIVHVDTEAIQLMKNYLKSNLVPRKYENDALHVTLATISKCSILVSWNFNIL